MYNLIIELKIKSTTTTYALFHPVTMNIIHGVKKIHKKSQCGIRTEKIYNNIVEENKFMTEYNCRLRKDKL